MTVFSARSLGEFVLEVVCGFLAFTSVMAEDAHHNLTNRFGKA